MREITKVKRLNDEVSVLWTAPNGQTREKGALEECSDTPHDGFLEAMTKVEADLAKRTGFAKQFADSFTLTGISVTRNRSGRRQFTPSCKLDFGWGETGVSMPLLLAPDSEKPSGADNVLTSDELANLEDLLAEGGKYAAGERHQGKLELDDGPGDDDPTDPFDDAEEKAA